MGYCAFEQRKLKLESNLTQNIIHELITWSSFINQINIYRQQIVDSILSKGLNFAWLFFFKQHDFVSLNVCIKATIHRINTH